MCKPYVTLLDICPLVYIWHWNLPLVQQLAKLFLDKKTMYKFLCSIWLRSL